MNDDTKSTNRVTLDCRITFEDNTRINFTGEGITEIVPGNDGIVRHRHNQLVMELINNFKAYIKYRY